MEYYKNDYNNKDERIEPETKETNDEIIPVYCELCEKRLVPIGQSRKNGKDHRDWDSRRFHKKCVEPYRVQKELEKSFINNGKESKVFLL